MNEHGLYRTMKLKYVPYFTDGNGRDRYIAFDNGGFFGNKDINKANSRRTGTSFDTKITYKYISPYMKTPNFHYHSDGNGRDSYIYTNGGGLYYDTKPLGSYKLTDFLREDSVGATRQKIWVSKAQHKYNKFLRNKEKGIINRLYENEKGKFIKKKKEEDEPEEEYFQTEYETAKLPKINENYRAFNTINNNFENDEEPKGESRTIDTQRRKRNFMVKSGINNNDNNNDEMILKSISKINQFDVAKKLKRINKSFNQAYFHLRNNNLNY